MGNYCTTTALSLVMIGVDFTVANGTTLAAKAITHAEAEVNKYLSKRYDISSTTFQTTTSIPPMVTMLTEKLAEGYMWRWLSRGSKETLTRGEALIKDAKENLSLIANYKSDVLDTSGDPLADMSNTAFSVRCNTTDYSNTFNEDDEKAWAVDEDKVDDISDGRD